MITCHLSTLMGKNKMKIADVARETKLNRSTITALYSEKATRIDLDTIEKLCELFECEVGDLLEITKK
jgi:putative transcriptional regulator